MVWAKFTDKLHDNDKIGALSDAAFRLWVLAVTWSNDELTDGHIPSARPIKLMTFRNPKKTLSELVTAKVFHLSAHPCKACIELRASKGVTDPIPSGGWVIHDYHEFQKPAWVVRKEREHLRSIGAIGGRRSTSSRALEQAPRSSATLSAPLERHAQAPRSSATLSAEPENSSGTLERHAQPPYSRTPVLPSSGAIAPVSPDDPFPEDADRSRDQVRRGGVRHVGGAAQAVVSAAEGRSA